MTDIELIKAIHTLRDLMIAVATGGPRIDSVNTEYMRLLEEIHRELEHRKIEDPNRYMDLWLWYGKWSSGDMPTYQSRRTYIAELYGPLIQALKSREKGQTIKLFPEVTGWVRVDRGLGELRSRLEKATTEEQFQTVGLLCREVLISLGQEIYIKGLHNPADGVEPSKNDAKRMLEAYILIELSGEHNQIARRHARAALDLANELQHRRTASFRNAALCAEATTSVVNLIAIVSGRRDPD